jgi:N-acetylglucosamine-6-phosphate deacetylase
VSDDVYALKGAEVLLPGGVLGSKTICVDRGIITSVLPAGARVDFPSYDISGQYLSSGFVDIHVNGGGGASFEAATGEAIRTVIDTGVQFGTTSVLAAINTAMPEDRLAQLAVLDRFSNEAGKGEFLGAYLEGPYYNFLQRGAHNPDWIHDPDADEYGVWLDRFGDLIRVVTLAPELEGGLDAIRALHKAGIVAAIGHTMATDVQVDQAIEAGASLVTHIYNAQSTYTRNDDGKYLGVAEMGLLRDELTVEVIPDNRHLTPRMQQLVIKTKPHDLICITTDAMEATGQGPGTYEVMGGVVWVDDEVAYREDRTRHAGSILTMDRGVRNMVKAGATVASALMMASEVPARTIGVDDRKGKIAEGADADFVVLNKELEVMVTVCKGQVAFEAEGSNLIDGVQAS